METEKLYEAQRLSLAKELFKLNRQLRARDSDVAALRYVGVGVHVYCCMMPLLGRSEGAEVFSIENNRPDGTVAVEEFQVIKLSPDQAQAFSAVRRLVRKGDAVF